jgi:hypothetical protein
MIKTEKSSQSLFSAQPLRNLNLRQDFSTCNISVLDVLKFDVLTVEGKWHVLH